MSRLLPFLAAILIGACPAAAAVGDTLAVVFEVELGRSGEIESLKVDHVTDSSGGKRRVDVPQAYLEAARDALEMRYRGKEIGRFYTYTLYDPGRPNDARLGADKAPPADSRRTLTLRRGQTATLRLRPDGRLELVERGSAADAPASQIEDVFVRAMASGALAKSPEGKLPESSLKHLPQTPLIGADAVRLTMKQAPGGGTALVVENGYDRTLYYRAWMLTGERGRATSVCEVPPKLPSYEHWPHPIDQLDLAGFGLRRPEPGQAPECR
ncbi:MAG TPA: hypothetical protein VFZ91_06970 [Allosphingosinicella sp.]